MTAPALRVRRRRNGVRYVQLRARRAEHRRARRCGVMSSASERGALRAASTAAGTPRAMADHFAVDEVLGDLGRPGLRALLGLPARVHPEPEGVVV